MFQLAASIFAVIFLGLLQFTNFFAIGHTKPQLVLIFLIAVSVRLDEWLSRLLLVLIGAVTLKFYPGTDAVSILFMLASLIGITIVDTLPWTKIINAVIAIIVSIIIINITDLNLGAMVAEFIYSLVIFLVFYWVLHPREKIL